MSSVTPINDSKNEEAMARTTSHEALYASVPLRIVATVATECVMPTESGKHVHSNGTVRERLCERVGEG